MYKKYGSRYGKKRKYTIYVARVTFKPLVRKKNRKPIRIEGWRNTKKFLNKLNQRGIKSYAKRNTRR